MGTVVSYDPYARGPGAIARLAWCASQGLMEAAASGLRGSAARNGSWLTSLREDARCTPALSRLIDGSLSAAARRLGGTAPTFEPLQASDGDVG